MRTQMLSIALLISISAIPQDITEFRNHFPLKWKTKIGGVTFKTNFVSRDGLLIVGSNGEHYRDWALDKNNGVYFIDPPTGKILHRVAFERLGDMDVNGIAAGRGKIFFGNDNEEFLCYDTCGNKIWRMPASGDVESEPVLADINCDGVNEVIFGTETGEAAALDSRNGKTIWSFRIKDFSGWEKTENRFVFKVGAYFSAGSGFVAKPAITDLTGDGVPDFIYNCRDNYTYALNGENGDLLWKFNHGAIWYIANEPMVIDNGSSKHIYLFWNRSEEDGIREDLRIVRLNEKGILQKSYPATWHYSINYAPVEHNGNLLSITRDTLAVLNIKTGHLRKISIAYEDYFKTESYYSRYHAVTARPVLYDILGKGSKQLILVNEYGTFQIIDSRTFKTLKYFMLPSGTETTPLISDIDSDGKMEMLIGCYDGYLYCYDLKIPASGEIAGLK